ncbi:hypothetical protein ES707_04048 [subsurface metagenome]
MKIYTSNNTGAGGQKVTVKKLTPVAQDRVETEAYELPLKPSLKLFNHSPDGFQFGYQGSGCAQLALAILLDLTKDPDISVRLHQEFKRHFIATSGKRLLITEPDILTWLLWLAKREVKR